MIQYKMQMTLYESNKERDQIMYELYSYVCADEAYLCDYVFSFDSFISMTKYMDEHRENIWLFIDNSGRTYADFVFSEKELMDMIFKMKRQKYVKIYGMDSEVAYAKAEEECVMLRLNIIRAKNQDEMARAKGAFDIPIKEF